MIPNWYFEAPVDLASPVLPLLPQTHLNSFTCALIIQSCHYRKTTKEAFLFLPQPMTWYWTGHFKGIKCHRKLSWNRSLSRISNTPDEKQEKFPRNGRRIGRELGPVPTLFKSKMAGQLQYSSQIVETDTVSLEFSGKILTFLLHTVFLSEMCLLPPQCWATRVLTHWNHCDTQINIGEGETDTSVSRFLTSIVFSLKSNGFCSRRIFRSSMEYTCLVRAQMRKRNLGCRIIVQLYLKIKGKDKNKGI